MNILCRTVLLIPILEFDDPLGFGFWVSQEKEDFVTYSDNFHSSDIGPFFGCIANGLVYGGVSTSNLKTMVKFQGDGQRPLLELNESDHPLDIAQKNGVSMDEAWKFLHSYLD